MSLGWARRSFGAVVASYVVVLGWLAVSLPDRVPMHFDAGGTADDWASRAVALAFWAGVGLFILGGGWLLARNVTRGDGAMLNLPHKEHWLQPERRGELRVVVEAALLVFAAWTGLLLVTMMLITKVAAAGDGSTPGWWFWACLAVYLAGTAAWFVALDRRLRPTPSA